MSTTTPRTLKAGADVRLRGVYESYVRALGDLDKAGDVEDAAYYQGEVDAYLDVLDTFGELEPEEVEPSSAAETEKPTTLVEDLRAVREHARDRSTDDWDVDTITAAIEALDAPARKVRLDIETGGNYA